jgi:N-acetyl sugar amidotransferase
LPEQKTEGAAIMMETNRVCSRCVMDTSDPDITFDDAGVCSHCRAYDAFVAGLPGLEERSRELDRIIAEVKEEGRGKEYDCILGLSGGVDSSYAAYISKQLGLRPLVVHFDSGWNSEIAVKNIENIVRKLGYDLYTHVVDWEEMKDLQLAYLRASVINADIPQDYAFISALYELAGRKGIRYFISGYNYQSEFILPRKWVYDTRDLCNLKAIHKRFGKRPLKKYPLMSQLTYIYHRLTKKKVDLLYYMDYNKLDAMRLLERELDWRYYGGKHYESVWTKFYQAYYLPTKFGIDKRRAHLSSLVVSGQMSREAAMAELGEELYPPDQLRNDIEYICRKLDISRAEFDEIMAAPVRSHFDFPTDRHIQTLIRFGKRIKELLGK